MSATAESFQHIKPDDTLARRNAIVLAVAQALAGGNNTVIVSTASIVGAVLAPDKGLATLPITAMVFGCRNASMSTSRSCSTRPETSRSPARVGAGADDFGLGMQ